MSSTIPEAPMRPEACRASALRLQKALDTAEQLAERFSHERLREVKSDLGTQRRFQTP